MALETFLDSGATCMSGGRPKLTGVAPAVDAAPPIPENTVLHWSDDGSDLASFLTATGSQWGPFAVHVQVHEVEPASVDEVWEDVVAVSVRTTDTISIDESQGEGPVEAPLEHYLVELWPAPPARALPPARRQQ